MRKLRETICHLPSNRVTQSEKGRKEIDTSTFKSIEYTRKISLLNNFSYTAVSDLFEIDTFKFPILIVDKAADICHGALFNNHGQNCCAGSRTFVHESLHDDFVKKATTLARKRRVGNPFEDGVQQGPQVSTDGFTIIIIRNI